MTQSAENDAPTVHLDLTEGDARFAVEHLRFLVDRETATTADHAAAKLSARWLADQIERAMTHAVHDHPPYRPVCNERRLPGGQLRGACLNDDGTTRPIPPDLDDFQRATVEAFASMTPAQRRAAINTPRARVIPPA